MKPHPSILLLLVLGLNGPANAQSLSGLAPAAEPAAPGSEKEVAPKNTGEPLAQHAAELASSPSRYAGIDVDAYVNLLSASFAMRKRTYDPFGRHQDPNFKPVQPAKPKRRVLGAKPTPVMPFVDIIRAIRVTAVFPSRGMFMVDSREFHEGQRIPLKLSNGKDIPIHVIKVAADAITFRNGETNETALLDTGLKPDGLTRGDGRDAPPGMIEKNANAPLIIDNPGAQIGASDLPFSSSR